MLIFYLGREGHPKGESVLEFPQKVFEFEYLPEWLESEFGRRAVRGVDNSEVISGGVKNGGVISSPIYGNISPMGLSGGVRTLLMARYCEKYKDYWYPGERMGDNVYPFLAEAARECPWDIKVRSTRLLRMPWDGSDTVMFLPEKREVRGYEAVLGYLALNAHRFYKGEGYIGR